MFSFSVVENEAKIPEKIASGIIFSHCNFINNSSISKNFSLKFDMCHFHEWDQQGKLTLCV